MHVLRKGNCSQMKQNNLLLEDFKYGPSPCLFVVQKNIEEPTVELVNFNPYILDNNTVQNTSNTGGFYSGINHRGPQNNIQRRVFNYIRVQL